MIRFSAERKKMINKMHRKTHRKFSFTCLIIISVCKTTRTKKLWSFFFSLC